MKIMKPDYLLNIEIPSDLSMDDKGNYLCFKIRRNSQNSLSHVVMLWVRSEEIVLQLGEGYSPVISPDGDRIAWVEPSENTIVIYSLQDGHILKVDLFSGISELSWSPDSKCLLMTCKVPRKYRNNKYPKLERAQLIDRLKFKIDGGGNLGIWDKTFRQVLLLELKNDAYDYQLITHGERDHKLPFWIHEGEIGYVSNNNKNPDLPNCYDRDSIIILSIKDNTLREIKGPGGPIEAISVSPDRKNLAFVGHDYSFFEATNYAVYIMNVNSEKYILQSPSNISFNNHVLSDIGLKKSTPAPVWLSNKEIACVATQGGSSNLWLGNLESGFSELLKGDRAVYDTCSDKTGSLVFISSSSKTPAEIILYKDETEYLIWKSFLDNIAFSQPERFLIPTKDIDIEAWYMPPVGNVNPKGIILAIHGGPHVCYGNAFSLDFQIFSSAGFGVIYGNPSGSQGYGQDFSASTKNDWGGQDFQDVLSIIKTAKEAFLLHDYKWAIIGASYGGFMANWSIGHTDCFSCAISERGTANRYSQAGTSDCAYRYGNFEFDGTPWENPEFYLSHSPISYVANINTPLLLIHGENDMNCHITQSEEMFMALKALEKEILFARFPGASHSFASRGESDSRLDRYRLVLWWLEKHIT